MKFFAPLLAALCATAPVATAYTAEEQAAAIKTVTDKGFPPLAAFSMMTPKLLTVVMENYLNLIKPDTLEHITPLDLEVIWTAVSSANNCEICLSFHAMVLGSTEGIEVDTVDLIAKGGVPAGTALEPLVIAAKYAMAHKGIFLEREKKHLAMLGIEGDKLIEITFAVGQMSALNMLYIHLISEGVDVEDFLQGAGPFKKTVYKEALAKAEL
jgi:AhpD family alkylhydroperoxidase